VTKEGPGPTGDLSRHLDLGFWAAGGGRRRNDVAFLVELTLGRWDLVPAVGIWGFSPSLEICCPQNSTEESGFLPPA
jgi:hypothetical protein